MHFGEIWDFVASAKGGSGLHSADFASQNPLRISNYENVSLGDPTGKREYAFGHKYFSTEKSCDPASCPSALRLSILADRRSPASQTIGRKPIIWLV